MIGVTDHCLTRDQAVEGVGKIRVEWGGCVEGILIAYTFGPDTVTIGADYPSTAKLVAPRVEVAPVEVLRAA